MHLVETTSALQDLARLLSSAPRIYLDTEFESSRQGSRLCLVQLSVGDEVYLVDTIRLPSLVPLREALRRESCEWIFHAGGQDVPLLLEHLELDVPPRLFDTQVAWALLSAEYSVSLVYLLYRSLGLRTAKTHQADDWQRRPLPHAQLRYAAADVEHLPSLHDFLLRRARELGREEAIGAATKELMQPQFEPPPRLSLSSFRSAWQLDPPSQAGLRFLIAWYNSLDEERQRQSPEPKVLVSIASRMPASAEELEHIKGVPRQFARRHGDELTRMLMRASTEAVEEDFVPIEPLPYATFEEILVDAWLGVIRAEASARAQVAPELAFPSRMMKRIRTEVMAKRSAEPLLRGLAGWRSGVLGPELCAACERHPLALAV